MQVWGRAARDLDAGAASWGSEPTIVWVVGWTMGGRYFHRQFCWFWR